MSSIRDGFKAAFAICFGLALAFALLEIVFRILPTADTLNVQSVNRQQPYLHFEPNRTVTLSDGKLFDINIRKRVNNYGYLSDLDFNRDRTKSKIVVIGDSYVEAAQVTNQQSIHGVMNKALQPRAEVYGIGASGSALSQYLAYAKFAMTEFQPDALVFVIISNDFDESVAEFKREKAYHYFSITENGYEHVLVEYARSAWKQLPMKSAFLRYLLLNAKIQTLFAGSPKKVSADETRFIANVPAQASQRKMNLSMKAVDIFLGELKELTRARAIPVVFVVDGIRQEIYEADIPAKKAEYAASYARRMADYFSAQAGKSGFEVIDMHPVFERHYLAHKSRFEFPGNYHWNALGHSVAADAALRSKSMLPFIGQKQAAHLSRN